MAEPGTLSPSIYATGPAAARPPADDAPPELPANPYAPLTLTHTVEAGETLVEIASRHQTSVQRLLDHNPRLAAHPDLLARGTTIEVPVEEADSPPHEVALAPGQTLTDLARQHGLTLGQLWQANRHTLRDGLAPGEPLWVPGAPPGREAAPPRAASPDAPPATVAETQPAAAPFIETPTLPASPALVLPTPGLLAEPAAPPAALPAAALPPAPATASPALTTSLTLSDIATRSASAGLLRLDLKGPVGERGSFKLSAADLIKLPDEGARTSIVRASADLYKTLCAGPRGSVQAGMGVAAWAYVNLQDGGPGHAKGYDKTVVFNTADLGGSVKLGAGVDLHAKAGAWTALDPLNHNRTFAPYAQGGVGVSVQGLQLSDDVRSEFQLKHALPDLQYVYHVLDVSLRLSDTVSANARWTCMLQGEAPGSPPDVPQGERHENKLSAGVTVSF